MVSNSPCCVVWRFKPLDTFSGTTTSKAFFIQNSGCELQIKFDTYQSGKTKASLTLKISPPGNPLRSPFQITTYARIMKNSFTFPSEDVTCSSEKVIWSYMGKYQKFYADWEIVCLFQDKDTPMNATTHGERRVIWLSKFNHEDSGSLSPFQPSSSLHTQWTYDEAHATVHDEQKKILVYDSRHVEPETFNPFQASVPLNTQWTDNETHARESTSEKVNSSWDWKPGLPFHHATSVNTRRTEDEMNATAHGERKVIWLPKFNYEDSGSLSPFPAFPSLCRQWTYETLFFPNESHWQSESIGIEGLSADFSTFLEDQTFRDVTLRCGSRRFPAHRVVLAARSEVFAAMFRNKMAESETGIVDISDMEPEILELFLKYVYSGKIQDLSEKNVSSLYSTGDKYAVRTLQNHCRTWMLRHLTRENCLPFLLLAEAHGDEDLLDEIVLFIVNDGQVLKSGEWCQFKVHNPRLAAEVYQMCLRKRVVKDN